MDAANKLPIGIIVLAAGGSIRLGRPKQLLKFRGESLVKRAAETALATGCEKVVVVLGANFEKTRKEVENLPLEIAVNENWTSGMSSSVKTGLKKLLKNEPRLSAVVIQLCDQPLINSSVLDKLIEIYRRTKANIVASEYAQIIGVPALFADSLFSELLNLETENGAKQIIKKYISTVEKVCVPEAEIDIDTQSDYDKLLDNRMI